MNHIFYNKKKVRKISIKMINGPYFECLKMFSDFDGFGLYRQPEAGRATRFVHYVQK